MLFMDLLQSLWPQLQLFQVFLTLLKYIITAIERICLQEEEVS